MTVTVVAVGEKVTASKMNEVITDLNAVGTAQIVPTAATNGAVSSTGVVTSGAVALVRVRTAFPSTFRVFEIDYDFTTSGAASINVRLAVDATDAATAYDNQRFTIINATAAAVQALNATDLQLSPISLAGRHVGRLVITNPNQAEATLWHADGIVTANPMTTSAGITKAAGLHRTLTAYNSFSVSVGVGNVTVNRLTVKGVS